MENFLVHILFELGKLGIGLFVLGLALLPIFKKVGKSEVLALIPYVNVFTWVRMTKNPWWLGIVFLQFYWLPESYVRWLSLVAFLWLVFSTVGLFRENAKKTLWTSFISLLALIPFFIQRFETQELYILYAFFALGILYLLFIGTGMGGFLKSKYYSDEFDFKEYAAKQFRKNKPALISLYILGFLIFIGVYAPYIANDQPIYVEYHGERFFPAWKSITNPTFKAETTNPETGNQEFLQFDVANWKEKFVDKMVWAPVPWGTQRKDRYNREYVGPFAAQRYKPPGGELQDAPLRFRHHMGTDVAGLDLTAGLIHGTRISLTIGLIAMGIAAFLGLFLGSLAGFYGDTGMRTTRIQFWLIIIGVLLSIFYLSVVNSWMIALAALILFCLLGWALGRAMQGVPFFGKRVTVPMDSFVLRSIEILRSLPRLIIIITISSLAGRGLTLLMVIIGLTSWTGIARLTRAEFLRTRSLDYIQAAKSLGFKDFRTIFRHALPNSMAPVFVAIAFGIASAILIESGLSFLGIGVPDDVVTWGGLLSKGSQELEAIWLVLFPGLAIFLTVTVYNLIGDALRDALDPRLKQ